MDMVGVGLLEQVPVGVSSGTIDGSLRTDRYRVHRKTLEALVLLLRDDIAPEITTIMTFIYASERSPPPSVK